MKYTPTPFREYDPAKCRTNPATVESIDWVRAMYAARGGPSNRRRNTALRCRLRRMAEFIPVLIACLIVALVIALIMLWAANL